MFGFVSFVYPQDYKVGWRDAFGTMCMIAATDLSCEKRRVTPLRAISFVLGYGLSVAANVSQGSRHKYSWANFVPVGVSVSRIMQTLNDKEKTWEEKRRECSFTGSIGIIFGCLFYYSLPHVERSS